ncbi:MAG: DNA primase [Thermoprotei archaeon]|nr:MAG: DNA primase [Thermoprotei archaeon]
MGGVSITAKYLVHAIFEVDGIVDKPDVIGAIFGQTEGLLGDELDLRELQMTGRIGRIEVELEVRGNKTYGKILIPSNLDRVETSLIAAALEAVDKVGPYSAKIKVVRIEDLRSEKRKKIIERAKELLRTLEQEELPDTRAITEEVLRAVREVEIVKYGPEGLTAGPDVDRSDTIIIVEGRADVINLVRHGYRNVIALEGATVPKTIIELCKKKTAIAFVDGDRGGEMVLRELLRVADIDYVARAPPGKEVEELSAKEIAKCLRNKVPADQVRAALLKEEKIKAKPAKVEEVPQEEKPSEVAKVEVAVPEYEIPTQVLSHIKEIQGRLEAYLYDENWNVISKIPVRDLVDYLQTTSEKVHAVVFDGLITQRILDIAGSKGVKVVIGFRVGGIVKKPSDVKILTFDDVLKVAETASK